MQHPSGGNKSTPRVSIIFLWVVILFFLTTPFLGVFALVTKQDIIFSIISFLLTFLGIIIGVLQVNKNFIKNLLQTFKTGRLEIMIALLLFSLAVSLGWNVYSFLSLEKNNSPLGFPSPTTRPSPTITPSPITPTITTSPIQNIALIQSNFASGAGVTQLQVTLDSPVAAKNVIVVATTQWLGTVTSISDTQGNTYLPVTATQHANPTTDYVDVFYAKNIKGGATSVTVKFSSLGNNIGTNDENVGVYEFSGLNTINPIDQSMGNTSKGQQTTQPNAGVFHASTESRLYFVVGVDDGNKTTPVPGSRYTLLNHQDNSDNERYYAEYQIGPSQSLAANFSIANPSYWAIIGFSCK